jgi:hypothetical protein
VETLTHDDPHVVPVHVDAQCGVPVEESHVGAVVGHAVVHALQWSATLRAVSQPSVGSLLQSPYPGAQDVAGTTHLPALQVVAPVTCGRAVQSFAHEPHV